LILATDVDGERGRAEIHCCKRSELLQSEPLAPSADDRPATCSHAFNSRIAVLLGPDGERYQLPVLTKIRVLELNERGRLLSGYEVYPPRGAKGKGPVFPQKWWCVLRNEVRFAPVSVEGARALARSRNPASGTSSSEDDGLATAQPVHRMGAPNDRTSSSSSRSMGAVTVDAHPDIGDRFLSRFKIVRGKGQPDHGGTLQIERCIKSAPSTM